MSRCFCGRELSCVHHGPVTMRREFDPIDPWKPDRVYTLLPTGDARRAVDLLNEAQVEHRRAGGWAYSQTHDCGIVCACGWAATHDNANLTAAVGVVEAAYREHLSCVFLVALSDRGHVMTDQGEIDAWLDGMGL